MRLQSFACLLILTPLPAQTGIAYHGSPCFDAKVSKKRSIVVHAEGGRVRPGALITIAASPPCYFETYFGRSTVYAWPTLYVGFRSPASTAYRFPTLTGAWCPFLVAPEVKFRAPAPRRLKFGLSIYDPMVIRVPRSTSLVGIKLRAQWIFDEFRGSVPGYDYEWRSASNAVTVTIVK